MQHNKGFGLTAIIIIVGVAIVGGAIYTSKKNTNSEPEVLVQNEVEIVPPNMDLSDFIIGYIPEEDGEFQAYIKRIYTDSGMIILEADYFQTLRGKQAALRAVKDGSCYSETLTKDQMLTKVNSLKDDDTFEDKFYELEIGCFYNGIWLDVNDNTKIRTLEVELAKPIIMALVREQYGPYKQLPDVSANEISLDTLRKIIVGVNYDIPFSLTVSGGKITAIQEIYRP